MLLHSFAWKPKVVFWEIARFISKNFHRNIVVVWEAGAYRYTRKDWQTKVIILIQSMLPAFTGCHNNTWQNIGIHQIDRKPIKHKDITDCKRQGPN